MSTNCYWYEYSRNISGFNFKTKMGALKKIKIKVQRLKKDKSQRTNEL